MARYGMMKHFNGIDISQLTIHISISSKTYLDTVLKKYVWDDIVPTSLPINPSNEFVRALYSAITLESAQHYKIENGHFRYRTVIGELIWPMITTHPELSYPVVKLSQFPSSPASIHYDAVFGIFQYLSRTRNDGLTYTHTIAMNYGPIIKHAPLRSNPTYRVDEHITKEGMAVFFGYSGSNWSMDIRHRRSISGMVFFLAGAVVAWKTRVQPTVAQSTAESEFLSARDSGHLGIFV
jgi:hypothetical protein